MTDDDNTLEAVAIKEIESAVFRKVFFVVLAGAIGFGGFIGLGGVRPDPATGTDLKHLKEYLKNYTDREIQHAMILIEAKMPPDKTKAKIRNLESSAERVDPDFQAVYEGWD